MSRAYTASNDDRLDATPELAAYHTLASDTLTIAAWVKRSSGVHTYVLLQDGATNSLYDLYIGVGDVMHMITAGSGGMNDVASTDTTPGSGWHHYAAAVSMVSGDAYVRFYLDGVADSGNPVALTNATFQTSSSYYGALQSQRGAGTYIALLTAWNTLLSPANILSAMNTPNPELIGTGCFAAWHLLENELVDYSSNAQALTVAGTVDYSSDNPVLSSGGFKIVGGGVGPPVVG